MSWVQVVGGPILVLTAIAFAVVAWRLRGSLDRPGGTGLVAVVALLALVTLAEGVVHVLGFPVAMYHPLTQIAVFGGTIGWAAFVIAYTGRRTDSRAVLGLVIAFPGAGLVAAFLRLAGPIPLEYPIDSSGALYLLVFGLASVASFGLLVGLSMLLIWDATRYASFERKRGVALSLVGLALAALPVLSSLLEQAEIISVLTGGIVAQLTVLVAVLVAVGVGRPYRTLPIAEAIGRDAIVSNLRDAVVVVDQDAHVVDMNRSAEQLFDRSLEDVVRDPLSLLLPAGMTGVSGLPTDPTMTIDGPAGRRHYDVSVSSVANDGTTDAGYAVALRDVTDERIRRQRLEVLHRVLRHNVRNDVTALFGVANAVEATGEPDLAAQLRDTADSLVDVSDQARTVEETMRLDPVGDGSTDVAELARETVNSRSPSGPRVSLTVEGDCEVDRSAELVSTVCEELVSYAFDTAVAPIRVLVERDDEHVALGVESDEQFVPAQDLIAVGAGHETQLEHAEDLDIWAVSWGVDRLGGELTADEATGRRVTVRIPVD